MYTATPNLTEVENEGRYISYTQQVGLL